MGVLDKIKNALFEVEYVEVEEPPKKEKKVKPKENKADNKPIAKKIVLPGKKEEKVEEIEEEELLDQDFEIRPKEEVVKEEVKESFKLMDDDDFKVDDTDYLTEEPQIIDEEKEPEDTYKEEYVEPSVSVETNNYQEKAYSNSRESRPYGVDTSYNVPVHQYGSYERYEERTYFKPSPIISPIYGILDKNYKKEDVREKRNVGVSSYSRENISVDDIRNKAYGRKNKEEDSKTEIEVDTEEDNLMVDLSDQSKPEVKELTVGDALEYFQDLGLEYNVDYVDASTDKKTTTQEEVKEDPKEEKEEPVETNKEEVVEEKSIPEDDITEEKIKKELQEEKDDDDDNLFDLIDSMYQENN